MDHRYHPPRFLLFLLLLQLFSFLIQHVPVSLYVPKSSMQPFPVLIHNNRNHSQTKKEGEFHKPFPKSISTRTRFPEDFRTDGGGKKINQVATDRQLQPDVEICGKQRQLIYVSASVFKMPVSQLLLLLSKP